MTRNLSQRRGAALAGHLGDEVEARRLLGSEDPDVRATALGALDRMGSLTTQDIMEAAGDQSAIMRLRSTQVAATFDHAEHGEPEQPLLIPLLDDPDPAVVESAAWACGERQPTEPGSVEALIDLTRNHDDALCREAAVAALGAIGDPAATPAILAALNDKATVRRRAVISLAPFEGKEVEAALKNCLKDRDRQVKQVAEDLLDPNR